MTYDPRKDLVPITNLLRVPLVLAVNPAVPAKNLQELLTFIKAQGGNAAWASAGDAGRAADAGWAGSAAAIGSAACRSPSSKSCVGANPL